jgi:hypothetical protein
MRLVLVFCSGEPRVYRVLCCCSSVQLRHHFHSTNDRRETQVVGTSFLSESKLSSRPVPCTVKYAGLTVQPVDVPGPRPGWPKLVAESQAQAKTDSSGLEATRDPSDLGSSGFDYPQDRSDVRSDANTDGH